MGDKIYCTLFKIDLNQKSTKIYLKCTVIMKTYVDVDCMVFLTLLITSDGILEQSFGGWNQVGIRLPSYIGWRNRFLGPSKFKNTATHSKIMLFRLVT
jgi:hypothetical protein